MSYTIVTEKVMCNNNVDIQSYDIGAMNNFKLSTAKTISENMFNDMQ